MQEFEDFLEQKAPISKEILNLSLNQLSHPFAMWTYKTFHELDVDISPNDLKDFLLESNPEKTREFLTKAIKNEKNANKFYNSYNQWRMFIPVYEISQ